jgi:hypothetical protein
MPYDRLSNSEARDGFPALGSLFCALACELPCSGVGGGQTPVSTPLRPDVLPSVPPAILGGQRDPTVVHHPWTRSTGFPLLKYSLFWFNLEILQNAPGLLGNQPAVQNFVARPLVFEK